MSPSLADLLATMDMGADTSPAAPKSNFAEQARTAAEAWAAAMAQRKKPCVRAPWDEVKFFDTLQQFITPFQPNVPIQVAPADPMRVGLWLSTQIDAPHSTNFGIALPVNFTFNTVAGTGQFQVAPGLFAGASDPTRAVYYAPVITDVADITNGLNVPWGFPPLCILQRDWGPLCSMAWAVMCPGINGVTYALSLRLRDWPQ
jgi:hypothetical protein